MEARRLKRRHLFYYLRVFDTQSGNIIGHLVDLTAQGMKLVMEKPIPVQSQWKLKMVMPEVIEGKEAIEFFATCIWCQKDINPDFYVAGLQFHGISPQDIDVIQKLIQEFGFQD